MTKVLKAYTFPTMQLIGAILITISTLWYGTWYPSGEKSYISEYNKQHKSIKNQISAATFFDISNQYKFDMGKPVSYTLLSFIIILIGGLGVFKNQHKINLYDNLLDSKKKLDDSYRVEKDRHSETLKNYDSSIDYILQSIFISEESSIDINCRLSIYRMTKDNYFKRFYRYAEQVRYKNGGRIKLPKDEGIIAATWLNGGTFEFSSTNSHNTKAFNTELHKKIRNCGSKPLTEGTGTNMPSVEYFAKAIDGNDGNYIAIVVVESTEKQTLNMEVLSDIISSSENEIKKYITHKQKLDEILNPVTGETNA